MHDVIASWALALASDNMIALYCLCYSLNWNQQGRNDSIFCAKKAVREVIMLKSKVLFTAQYHSGKPQYPNERERSRSAANRAHHSDSALQCPTIN